MADDNYWQIDAFGFNVTPNSSICPTGNCEFEFEDGQINTGLGGDWVLTGRLKVGVDTDDGTRSTIYDVRGELDIVGNTTSWFIDDTFNIAGEINNNGSRNVDFVKVSATLYNVDGTVIGSDFTYTNPSTIPAGDRAPFQFRITDFHVRDVGEIDTYKLSVSGD